MAFCIYLFPFISTEQHLFCGLVQYKGGKGGERQAGLIKCFNLIITVNTTSRSSGLIIIPWSQIHTHPAKRWTIVKVQQSEWRSQTDSFWKWVIVLIPLCGDVLWWRLGGSRLCAATVTVTACRLYYCCRHIPFPSPCGPEDRTLLCCTVPCSFSLDFPTSLTWSVALSLFSTSKETREKRGLRKRAWQRKGKMRKETWNSERQRGSRKRTERKGEVEEEKKGWTEFECK